MIPPPIVRDRSTLRPCAQKAKERGQLTFHNRIHGATLLAEAAIDAFGHIDIVACGAPATILTLFGLDRDRRGRANGFAKLAGNAAFLA